MNPNQAAEDCKPSPELDDQFKRTKVLHRRLEEDLPIFGDLVEHADRDHLRYHEREDARNIELFFDLFFVAIFSTFTKNHEINSSEALSSYAVYFGVIWASWLQICLYDVRFGFDSIFERVTKAVQMCTFIGFASATGCLEMSPSTGLDPNKAAADLSAFESLNVLMIASRALFAVQYFVAWILVGRKHKPAQIPLIITSVMYAFVSIIYGLLFKFVLLDAGQKQSFYGYYAVIAFELAVISLVVYYHECVSFRDTHLHKRLMVLTLMILGEGIIVCAFGFAKISSKTGWTVNTFSQALCVILSIFFIYCLYFGNSGIERAREFRAAKQQIYTMLHLPFHLCLALTLEGLRTWTVIANVQYNFNRINGYVDEIIGATPDVFRLQELNSTMGIKIVKALNDTVKSFGLGKSDGWPNMQTALTKLQLSWSDDLATLNSTIVPGTTQPSKNQILSFYYTEFVSLVQNEQFIANGLVVPEAQVKAAKGSGVAKLEAYFQVFKMIFIYFFVCASFVLLVLGVFRSMSIGPRDRFDSVMITFRMAMGLLLGGMALQALMDQNITNYINSGVLLPTLLLVLAIVVLFEKSLTKYAIVFVKRRMNNGEHDSEQGRLLADSPKECDGGHIHAA